MQVMAKLVASAILVPLAPVPAEAPREAATTSPGEAGPRETTPILLPVRSVNQRFPSAPTAMPMGRLDGVGMSSSRMVPEVVMLPIRSPRYSVNHSRPSGPAMMNGGELPWLGRLNSVISPAGGWRRG
jgi:hypothetical protein